MRRGLSFAVSVVVGAALLAGASQASAAQDPCVDSSSALAADSVAIECDSTENAAEVRKGLAIGASQEIASPAVIYSTPISQRTANAQTPGNLLYHTDVQTDVSYCIKPDIDPDDGNGNPGSLCQKAFKANNANGYVLPKYDVHLRLTVYVSDVRDATYKDGDRVIGTFDLECPQVKHHCPIHANFDDTASPKTNPYPGKQLYVNVSEKAWKDSGPNGGPPYDTDDVLELEADCAADRYDTCQTSSRVNNQVDPDTGVRNITKGQLSVVELGSSYTASTTVQRTLTAPAKALSSHGGRTTYLFTEPSYDVRAGDIVEPQLLPVDVKGNNFDHDLQTRFVLTTNPSIAETNLRTGPARFASAQTSTGCFNPLHTDPDFYGGGTCEDYSQGGAVVSPYSASTTSPVYMIFIVTATDGSTGTADDPTGNEHDTTAGPEFPAGTTFQFTCDSQDPLLPCHF